MKFTFIVICYNRKQYLDNCLKAMHDQRIPEMEMIVISDGGEDFSDVAEKYGAQYYTTKESYGSLTGINIGIRKAKGEYVIITDADRVVGKDFLKELSKAIKRYPFAIYASSSGRRVGFRDSGCIWSPIHCMKKSFLMELGGYDERARGYQGDDVDLVNRFKMAGLSQCWIGVEIRHQEHPRRDKGREIRQGLWIERIDVYKDNLENNRIIVNQGKEWGLNI